MDVDSITPSLPDSAGDTSKMRPKRVITAARKEQNRIAQRAFRQRQKEHRANKGQKSRPRKAHMKPVEIQPRATKEVEVINQLKDVNTNDNYISLNNPIRDQSTVLNEPMNFSLEESVHPTASANTDPQPLLQEQFLVDDVFPEQENNSLDLYMNSLRGPPDLMFLPGLIDTSYLDTMNMSLSSVTGSLDTNLSLFQTRTADGNSEDNLLSRDIQRISLNQSAESAGPSLSNQAKQSHFCAGISNISELSSFIDLQSPVSGNEDESTNQNNVRQFADPYQNTLQFSHMTLLHICAQNAQCLGLSPADFIADDCLNLSSPFYRPVATSDDPKTLLAEISKPHTPAFLRPVLSQVLFPHHPILDLLPLPEFRERAIMLSATSPAVLNLLELKSDILFGGLICWGARDDSSHGGKGQPWDIRSWEAAPWFLRKWRLLVGGKDGELWKQSAWWRKLRGEPFNA